MQLAVKLFDEKNMSQTYHEIAHIGTSEYLKVILCWWKIVNVRLPKSDYHSHNAFQDLIKKPNHNNIQYFSKLDHFFCAWETLTLKNLEKFYTSKLASDTFFN